MLPDRYALAGKVVAVGGNRFAFGSLGALGDTPQLYLGFPGASSNPAEPVKVEAPKPVARKVEPVDELQQAREARFETSAVIRGKDIQGERIASLTPSLLEWMLNKETFFAKLSDRDKAMRTTK